jgi:4-hydroxy-4-methyl-2-oxoglutarate aldolase
MSSSIEARFAALPASTVSDALDRHGLPGQCLSIKPLHWGVSLAGRAFTVQYASPSDGGTVADYIDDVPRGSVIVLVNDGRVEATVCGELLTATALRRGIVGTVIDGACRDVRAALDARYPIFSRAHAMRTGKGRARLTSVQVPVMLDGTRVAPGDPVIGDSDGIVDVANEHELDVVAAAESVALAETHIRRAVDEGTRLDEARKAFGYHELQRTP